MDRKHKPDRATERALHRIDRMAPAAPATRVSLMTAVTSTKPRGADAIDLIAVERAVNGDIKPSSLTLTEAQAAARILLRRGARPAEVERKTGILAQSVRQGSPDSAVTGRRKGDAA